MAQTHEISSKPLGLAELETVLAKGSELKISAEACKAIRECREYLDKKIGEAPIYGINTGFGDLHEVSISSADMESLQRKLVISHAAGMGDEVPADIVRLMLFLKVQSLSYGHSGVDEETAQRLVDMFNEDLLPVIYQQGSLGASGDLAPLAHMSLALLGLGEVRHKGEKKKASDALYKVAWEPLSLKSKEGLALLNGTEFMSAYGSWCLIRCKRLTKLADLCAAISMDAFGALLEPFDPLIQDIRPHPGQGESAAYIRELLKGSKINVLEKTRVQDPYSFRCVPQVHGASRDSLRFVEHTFVTELNSVTDNPSIFPKEDKIISGGNFHGQPLALGLDQLAIAVSELGSISERRTFQLLSGRRGLPPFLTSKPGLNSGFMIPQYTAASIASQNKQLSTPASVDSITSSNGQEDHVSMGANAATKAYQVVNNLERILAIEWFTAAQALEFRRPERSSNKIEAILKDYRAEVPFLEEDAEMHPLLDKTLDFVKGLGL